MGAIETPSFSSSSSSSSSSYFLSFSFFHSFFLLLLRLLLLSCILPCAHAQDGRVVPVPCTKRSASLPTCLQPTTESSASESQSPSATLDVPRSLSWYGAILHAVCLRLLSPKHGLQVLPWVYRNNVSMVCSASPSVIVVMESDPNTWKVQKNAYLLWRRHTICNFSGKSPLSSYKTTLKQHPWHLQCMFLQKICFSSVESSLCSFGWLTAFSEVLIM